MPKKKLGWRDLSFPQQLIAGVSGVGASLTILQFWRQGQAKALSLGVPLTSGLEQTASTNPNLLVRVILSIVLFILIYYLVKK